MEQIKNTQTALKVKGLVCENATTAGLLKSGVFKGQEFPEFSFILNNI